MAAADGVQTVALLQELEGLKQFHSGPLASVTVGLALSQLLGGSAEQRSEAQRSEAQREVSEALEVLLACVGLDLFELR